MTMKIERLLSDLAEVEDHLSRIADEDIDDAKFDVNDPAFSITDLAVNEYHQLSVTEEGSLKELIDKLATCVMDCDDYSLSIVQHKFGKARNVQSYVEKFIKEWIEIEGVDNEERKASGIRLLILMVLPDPPVDARESYLVMSRLCSVWRSNGWDFQEIEDKAIPVACKNETGIGSLKDLLTSLTREKTK